MSSVMEIAMKELGDLIAAAKSPQSSIDALKAETVTGVYNVVTGFAADPTGEISSSEAIQAAIDAAELTYGQVYLPDGTYKMTTKLTIDKPIKFVGASRRGVVLDFSELESGYVIEVAKTESVTGLSFGTMTIKGNSDINGFDIGASLSVSCADSHFHNMRIQDFNVGIKTTFTWDCQFQNVRVQGCNKPLQMDSQSNAIHFDTCQFVTYNTPVSFSNVDSAVFTNCDIANVSTGIAMSLFQSHVTLIAPYIENITSGIFTGVGLQSEVSPSALLIKGGHTSDNIEITVRKSNVYISVEGLRSGSKKVTINNILPNLTSAYVLRLPFEVISDDNSKVYPQYVTKWYGNTPSPYTPMGVTTGPWTVTTIPTNQQYATISVNKDFAGIQLTNGDLVVGQPYVLAYAIRSSTLAYLKHSAAGNLGISIQGQSEDLQVRYLPFIAETTDLSIYFGSMNVGIDIALLAIIKGSNFPTFDISEKRTIYGTATPTIGTWNAGDRIVNYVPTVGQPKAWVYTVSGTLGTLNGGSTTGGITTGTRALVVSSATGLYVGCYITIAGVTGAKKVTAINGLNVTIDTNANATVSAAAVAYSAPTAVSEGDL